MHSLCFRGVPGPTPAAPPEFWNARLSCAAERTGARLPLVFSGMTAEEAAAAEAERDPAEQSEESAVTRSTRWARDVKVDTKTDFEFQKKKHQQIREQFGTLLPAPLQLIADTIVSFEVASESCAVAGKIVLPPNKADARRRGVGLLHDKPGQAAMFRLGDSETWTLATLNGAADVEQWGSDGEGKIDVTFHTPSGPTARLFSVDELKNRAVATVARKDQNPTFVFLNANFYDKDTPPPPFFVAGEMVQGEGGDVQVTSWALCGSCQRWRVVPHAVYSAARKRGAKFTCGSVHTRRCDQALSTIEKRWHEEGGMNV